MVQHRFCDFEANAEFLPRCCERLSQVPKLPRGDSAFFPEGVELGLSCMNFDAMPVVQALEDRIGKPVVTSHAATLWRALALAGIDTPLPGYGRLLEGA